MELFETTGNVELAEILFDGTRSKGCGVVQFSQVEEAETAIGNLPNVFLFVSAADPDFTFSEIRVLHVWRTSSWYVLPISLRYRSYLTLNE